MKILCVVGARPNFMKMAPIISEIVRYNKSIKSRKNSNPKTVKKKAMQCILVHTGQHYDKVMSDLFFKDLGLPKPDISLGIGSASHAVQTAEIMKRFENVLLKEKPQLVLVAGDVNSTIACALVASKISYDSNGARPLIGHVEAGLRSFDRSMPEEINRILTDHVSDLLFVTEESGITNLKNEGISKDKIHFVGNTMIDTLLTFKDKAADSKILNKLGLLNSSGKKQKNHVLPYALLTLHRPANVDNKDAFLNIIQALIAGANRLPIIFPAHPRTQKRIKEIGLMKYFYSIENNPGIKNWHVKEIKDKIIITGPLGYLDFLCMMKNARIVLTDSGGIQEETTCLGIPCVTIRENTERPVTVSEGTNIIAGVTKEKVTRAIKSHLKRKVKGTVPENWDGKSAKRILGVIRKNL